ncbi:MAG: hypothetical protein D6806_08020 [Deltaproteobacteria bacterium]|nr:MAG: hypothetical protein D6806_08020 [Deltaproteobacteria bacterium]
MSIGKLRLFFATSLCMAALAGTSACIVIDHEGSGCRGDLCWVDPGEITFYWAFELEDGSTTDWCDVADVARIDVTVYNDWGEVEFQALDRPCGDTGAIIDNFIPGTYTLNLRGICPLGVLTHEGWWTADVYPGINELGVLTLEYVGACELP